MRSIRMLLLYTGSASMLEEMKAMLRTVPNISLVGASTGSRIGHTFRVVKDPGPMMHQFPSIKTTRASDIPKIIHLKQPRQHASYGGASKSFARSAQDMRISVPRTKPRKRNGSR
jgi:hypothetical protein